MILEHGELPPAVLAQEFADDETSVLCATMGMWAGLNVVGPACTSLWSLTRFHSRRWTIRCRQRAGQISTRTVETASRKCSSTMLR